MTSSSGGKAAETGFFVGNALDFSDVILRHAAAEFSSIHFERIATIDDILAIPIDQTKNCRIIVVNEGEVDELRKNTQALLERFTKTRLALAYRRPGIAQNFLEHSSEEPLLAKVGMLPMRLEIDHWMSILRLLICGERYIPYELFNNTLPTRRPEVAEKPARPTTASLLKQLTERETQILQSVSEGKQNKIIAAELDLSEHTVKLHIHNVMSKLGVNNRTEAAVYFLADRPGSGGSAMG